jgi:hypothetical protein
LYEQKQTEHIKLVTPFAKLEREFGFLDKFGIELLETLEKE